MSMQKLTLFDSIPDFATANCMCSFHNWYHYENTTVGNKTESNTIKVRDKLIHHTDQARAKTLQDLKVLKTYRHPCDRTYSYTNYDVCNGEGTRTDNLRTVNVAAYKLCVTKTWLQKDGHWHDLFCDMRPSEQWSFLIPHTPTSENLKRLQEMSTDAPNSTCVLVSIFK